jgi:hypothetical protein
VETISFQSFGGTISIPLRVALAYLEQGTGLGDLRLHELLDRLHGMNRLAPARIDRPSGRRNSNTVK